MLQVMTVNLLFAPRLQVGITKSFDLINTIRVAVEHLTGDVDKVVRAGADNNVLEALYQMPDGASGQNLRVFTRSTAEERDTSIAALWLYSLVGLYEVWAQDLPAEKTERACQFPRRGYAANHGFSELSLGKGFADIYASWLVSPHMGAYQMVGQSDPRHLGVSLDDALAVYRLYKECRNSLAHAGGKASKQVEQWGRLVAANASYLHVDQSGQPVPLPLFKEKEALTVSMAQVRCFVWILFRLSFTIDALFLLTYNGQVELASRWRLTHGFAPLSVSEVKATGRAWVSARAQEAEIPIVEPVRNMRSMLTDLTLVRVLR